MKFDVAFYDIGCNKVYNYDSLENDSLGGTEATTIRLAEGFASKGLKVGVILHLDCLPSTSPNGVSYLPYRWASVAKPKNVIHLRSIKNINKFPNAKNIIWMHDVVTTEHNNVSLWGATIGDTQCIAVSDWHVQNIKSLAPDLNVKRIYSPVDELCYTHPRPEIDMNQLVWMSSPHKGLQEALEVFSAQRRIHPALKLAVFNPGYFAGERHTIDGVRYLPKCSRADMRLIVSSSLALFYPTKFEETFGLVGAEAEALGVPVICDPVAALAESVSTHHKIDDIYRLQVDRPLVAGQDRFRFENIWPEWKEILV